MHLGYKRWRKLYSSLFLCCRPPAAFHFQFPHCHPSSQAYIHNPAVHPTAVSVHPSPCSLLPQFGVSLCCLRIILVPLPFSHFTPVWKQGALSETSENTGSLLSVYSPLFFPLCAFLSSPPTLLHQRQACINASVRSFSTSSLRHATHSWQGYINEVRGLLPLMPSLSFSNSEGTARLQKHMKLLGHVFLFLVCHLHSTIQEVVCLRIRTYSTFSFQTKGAHFERCNL